MARKGTKVKELARELGVTSRQLVERCRAEGFPVQNSITKLHPELERTIRGWFAAETHGGRDPSASGTERP